MPSIHILPESLSNKIAAGEVVERPASVVKELVENALDAEATKIIIEIEKGGKALIQVADNGSGMSHNDALLAIERYATSKIQDDQDLFSIRSLGFRGEALPSIAAVSKFTLTTRNRQADSGTQVVINGGRVQQVAEVGSPVGTLVSVKHLFFNTPARRKYLKTIYTEMAHIADVVASYALGRPDVQFILRHNGRMVKNWPSTQQHRERVADVLGHEHLDALMAIKHAAEDLRLNGWVSHPHLARSTSRGIYTFVNARYVRDKMLRHALFAGCAGRLMKGRYPVAVVYLQVPFDQVDVNVHPTKNEVRFARHRCVHDQLAAAVAEALRGQDRPKWRPTPERPAGEKHRGSIAEDNRRYGKKVKGALRSRSAALEGHGFGPQVLPGRSSRPAGPLLEQGFGAGEKPTRPDQAPIWSFNQFRDLRVVGQVHGTYIVCESPDGLICIDQHAAHERIYYEQLKTRSGALKNASQRMLIPETIELNYREADTLRALAPEFVKTGFDVEPFGGNTFVIKALPVILTGQAVEDLIRDIIEKATEIGVAQNLGQALDESLKVMACHGAIRARQRLTDKEMGELMHQLDRCDNPSHCPHGRPTWIRWTLKDLEKAFKRIV